MSDERWSAAEQRALAALARLPRATASDETRTRTRQAFLDAAAPPVAPPRPRRSRWAVLLAAAVLGVLAVAMIGRRPAETWVVLDVVQPEGVTVAGQPLGAERTVTGGVITTAAGSELELQLGRSLRFRMMPGTQLDLPEPPGRWFGRARRFEVAAGEMYGTTGGRKLDFALEFATLELKADLTGTTFAVFRTAEASCVCLWEGGITVTPTRDETAIELQPGQRVWVFRDGRPAEVLPLSDMETMKLRMMQDAGIADDTGTGAR